MTADKATCKVLYMPVTKRKEAAQPKSREGKKVFPLGPDGKTANQRLRDILEAHPTIRRESQLVRACNELLGKSDGDEGYVRQQSISRFLKDQDSLEGSKHLPVIAESLGIRAFWLQTGRGECRNAYDDLVDEMIKRREGSRRASQ